MSTFSRGLDRRRFLQVLSAATASAGLSGCHHGMYDLLAAGTLAPKTGTPVVGDLTIDTHCHIFNGTDIQLRAFLADTHQPLSQRLIDLASSLEKKAGVRGDAEWSDLVLLAKRSKCAVAGTSVTCLNGHFLEAGPVPLAPEGTQPETARTHIKGMRDQAFQNAKAGISATIQEQPATTQKDKETDASVSRMLDAQSHESFRKKVDTAIAKKSASKAVADETEDTCGDARNLGGDLETVVDYFLPRIVLAQLYLDTFCPAAGRNVDLMFAAMVDYDWWLTGGVAPLTPLKQQVKLMEQISILSGGRIHGFAPFCPLREVASLAGYGDEETGWSSLAFVQDAVLNRGCVGVKLYPPMGFAPYGNAQLDDPASPPWDPSELGQCGDPTVPHAHPNFWARNKLLPEWVQQKTIRYARDGSEERLGLRLDHALDSLYSWCEDEGVPILAHTNATNGVDCVYEKLATAEHWCKVLAIYPGLRVSFGHMGGFDDALNPSQTALPKTSQAFIDLMRGGSDSTSDADAARPLVYADSAFDAVLLSCYARFEQRLELAYDEPGFASRFLYGTDWSLLVHVGRNKNYLRSYEEVMKKMDTNFHGGGRKPSEQFFGWNAVDYAGLRSAGKARQRLEAFYARYCMPKPTWAFKVDAG
jgi:hypothetical protein